MVCFGLTTKNNYEARRFFKMVNEKLEEKTIIKNPFTGFLRLFIKKDELFIGFNIEPVYPPVFYYGLLWIGIVLLIWGLTLWLLPGIILFSLIFFWSRYFFYLFIILGLKKNRYKGKVKLLSNRKTINKLLKWGR